MSIIKSGKFMHICITWRLLSCHQFKVWVKPGAEQSYLYGNHVLKSGLGRITENTNQYQGVVVYSMADVPLVSFENWWHHTHCYVKCLYQNELFEKAQNNLFASVTLEDTFHFRLYDRLSSLSVFTDGISETVFYFSGFWRGSQVHSGVSASGSHVHRRVPPGRCGRVH